MPSRHAALALSLLLLSHPLLAEEELPAATAEEPAAPVVEPRAPLAERSVADATALEQQIEQKEQQQLQAGDEQFLALWLPANVAEPSGVVILLPGDDESADWPQSIGPLRRKLPNGGWHSLSLTLPDPNGDAPPQRSAEPTAEPPADAPTASEPTAAEAATDAKPAEATGATPAIDDAATAAAKVQVIAAQQKAHAERVLARIAAAISFAEQQKAKSVVLLGHGSGAYWAARYLAERKPATVHNLLLVAASLPAGYAPPLDELTPELQLATGINDL